jgi:hypothetical protein
MVYATKTPAMTRNPYPISGLPAERLLLRSRPGRVQYASD